ncbi:hypothetical protein Sjap_019894 [Stephania japonica]|uniref:Shq1 C-terminal domain-containing protein n=1 Tax=Stephania japonica TaxID=461633 RepID=A0AAP0EZM5_9MAGN
MKLLTGLLAHSRRHGMYGVQRVCSACKACLHELTSGRSFSCDFKLLRVLSSHDNLETTPLDVVIAGPENPLLPVNKLSSTPPSQLLSIHLVNVLYSYCFTLRLFNGDWHSYALGAAFVLFSISSVLGEGIQPQTVSEALTHCLEQTCSPVYKDVGGLQLGLGLINDTTCLLNLGGPAIICMLCDLQRLFEAIGRETK